MARLLARAAPSAPQTQLVFRWDLDKTYLKSEFETLRDMMRIPFEKAEDKVAAPGVAALIRAVRESSLGRGRAIRVQFVSASPPQIGRAIRRKLELDGIVYDSIVFKNQLQRLMRGKFRHLREQVGFKLTELLKARQQESPTAREYLFGDDWESDPLIYSLYADIVAGRVDTVELAAILRAVRVEAPLIDQACALAAALQPVDAVARIFINLERRTPPAQLRAYGGRLVPTFNYLQTAACLYDEDVLSAAGAVQVARSLLEDSSYSPERLLNSLADIVRRGHLPPAAATELREALARTGIVAPAPLPSRLERLRRWWRRRRAHAAVPAVAPAGAVVDYRTMVGLAMPADAASE
jgi:hypothetical protein